ncbi:MAG: hypothetical protein J3R72DRAFT_446250 [Linnemannia gamsii]|nr:MAG: hypothetical protein J3R72DRAFT_446250 [Linnemannia gamsii]
MCCLTDLFFQVVYFILAPFFRTRERVQEIVAHFFSSLHSFFLFLLFVLVPLPRSPFLSFSFYLWHGIFTIFRFFVFCFPSFQFSRPLSSQHSFFIFVLCYPSSHHTHSNSK